MRLLRARQAATFALALGCGVVIQSLAHAQGPITDNNFNVDLIATPALGSSRIIGLAGASTALAEGVDGVPYNPAGYATRFSWERDWWEYELGLGIQFPGAYAAADYFLNGRGRALGVDHFSAVDISGRLQLGDLGFGTSSSIQDFRLEENDRTSIDVNTTRIGAGYALLSGQLVVGAGVRIVAFDLLQDETPIVSFTGTSFEVGALVRPSSQRWRIGAALRSPVSATILDGGGAPQVAGYWLPQSVRSPWEFSAGFAWQWFDRPFNPRFLREKNVKWGLRERLQAQWCQREREQRAVETGRPTAPQRGRCHVEARPQSVGWWRAEQERRDQELRALNEAAQRRQDEFHELWRGFYESRPRRYLLLSADVVVLGRTENAVGLDAFVRQERFTRGENTSVGVRVGAESEVIPHWLKLRVGTYLEPARYDGVRARVHGTAGMDLRLFRGPIGTQWRVTFFVDGAARYVNWGLSIGTWH